ncbi:hypothetical protein [Vulcaniibacterium gelatinicum]|uniref:hypothetical protein n=1 Tax=Vulcaniibacterium gelatinicum TaxID=2598725 RepID=UPI0011CB1ADB|nr:hypothetical protein [Vulcaniibacterium gelatinicum]
MKTPFTAEYTVRWSPEHMRALCAALRATPDEVLFMALTHFHETLYVGGVTRSPPPEGVVLPFTSVEEAERAAATIEAYLAAQTGTTGEAAPHARDEP